MANHNGPEQEILDEAVNKTEIFFEKNGKKLSVLILTIIAIVLGGYGYYALVSTPRIEKAAELISKAQTRFDSQTPDFTLALNGDENGAGFLDVIDQYGSTPSGNLAKHYAGICYLRGGDLENAAKFLAKYSAVDGLPGAIVNAQNLGLQGDVAVQAGDFAGATKFYKKAVAAADNMLTAPMYLRKMGLVENKLGNNAKAIECFQEILDSYPSSYDAREAEKFIGASK